MTVDDLVFVGLNGYALALNRETGELVWSNNKLKSGYVTLLLDGDRLIVSTNGYIYCLDPLTGEVLWNNPLKGYGRGAPTSLVSSRGQSPQAVVLAAAAAIAAERQHSSAAGRTGRDVSTRGDGSCGESSSCTELRSRSRPQPCSPWAGR